MSEPAHQELLLDEKARECTAPSEEVTPTPAFHPDLRLARFLPRNFVTRRTLPLTRRLMRIFDGKLPPNGSVEKVDANVSLRMIRPAAARDPAPALLWIHGGGFVMGAAAQSDQLCRDITDRLAVVTASVEYRLAPEHPFPTPLEDCYAALRWLTGQPGIDPARIAIGGESAGGTLAASRATRPATR